MEAFIIPAVGPPTQKLTQFYEVGVSAESWTGADTTWIAEVPFTVPDGYFIFRIWQALPDNDVDKAIELMNENGVFLQELIPADPAIEGIEGKSKIRFTSNNHPTLPLNFWVMLLHK